MRKYYQQSVKETLEDLNSSKEGLTQSEANIRMEKFGKNELQEKKPASAWLIFVKQFQDLLVIILIIAAIISAISGEIESTIVILFVIIMNAILGTVQTLNAQKSLASLKQLSTPHSKVVRDGKIQEIAATEITVGDMMILEAGDVVSADGRIITNHSLQVNESALTGEVESVHKISKEIDEESALGDQKNMVFASGLVTYGRAKIVVTAIGMDTEIGKIATLMNDTKERKTPLQATLDNFSRILSFAIIGISILVFGLSVMQGMAIIDSLMFAVALAVAAIPEALGSIVTIVLSLGTNKMAKENAIIKNINSVESLGCVNVICSDKTGTLTQNKMTAQQVFKSNSLVESNELNEQQPLDRMLMLAAILCNDSVVNKEQRIGDPTELALVDLLATHQIDEQDTRKKYPRLDENPFDSERKLMATLHMVDDHQTLLLKGAPDEVLKKVTHIYMSDGIRPISEEDRKAILKCNHNFAAEGLRVLGFAYRHVEDEKINKEDESSLIFLGLISLMDPPRMESKQAVEDCLAAGIRPIMITGDHKVTACSIARSLGIYKDGDICLDGNELNSMSDEELDAQLEQVHVYARVAPEHKIRIVDAWQKKGNIVAMTGDGVNDAPALKQADIGIAMGITGTEVSKDAASMILTDDNFATIVKAVATGRNIYTNIKNAIIYLLSGNLSGIIIVLIASTFALPIPFLPVHLLFINLITDSLPAIAIGMEPASNDVLKEKPRNMKEGILTKDTTSQLLFQGICIAIVTIIAYFIGLERSHAFAMTFAFATLCFARLLHGFNCRGKQPLYKIGFFTNKYSWYAFITGFILLTAILLVPALHGLFSIAAVSIVDVLMIYALALLPMIVIQIQKMIAYHSTNKI